MRMAAFLAAAVALAAGYAMTAAEPAAAPKPSAPAAAGPMIVEEGAGDVTPGEIQAFKSFMQAAPLPTDNIRNAMVYGPGGVAAEALGRVFEISGDVEILDRMIAFTDRMLAARNDPAGGVLVWTGDRALVWPNSVAEKGKPVYSGSENGDVVGHIAYAAKLILQNKRLWEVKIPGGNAVGFGATYLDRARTYVREMDRTTDAFLLKWYVRPDTLRYYTPDSSLFDAGSRPGSGGRPVPWNQQMMLNNGFQRLAECHALLGDAPDRVRQYDAIVKASVDWFFRDAERCEVKGRPCYKWGYTHEDPIKHYEDTGHGGYDVQGLSRAYASGRYGITREMMLPLANTVACVLAQPGNVYMGRVDGTAGKHPPGGLGGGWIDLCEFLPELYPNLYAVNRGRTKSSPALAANLLWAKHRLHLARKSGQEPKPRENP